MFLPRLPVAAVLAVAAFTSMARAGDEPITVRGSVEQVDTATGRLDIQTADGKTLTLQVTKDTTVEVDGRTAKLADLAAGQRVRVTYRPADGRNQVVTLTARKTTGKDVAREAREALEAAKQYTYQQKEQYEQRLRQVMDDLDDRIDDLEMRARAATADARKKLEPQLRELKQKRAVVSERLEKVKAAAPAAWNELKAGVQKAVEELQRALDDDRPKPEP